MSTTSQTNLSTAFATDGTTYSFPFTFPVTSASELRGALVNDTTGVETPLVLATHFSAVLSTPPTEGGIITCRQSLPAGDPWPSGSTLRFWREVPLTQDMTLPGIGTKLSTTAIAATLDKLMRAVQQLASQAARALRVHNVQDAIDPFITEGQDDKVVVVESGAVTLAPRSEFKGDKGDKGDQGIQGVKGDTGSKGDTGETGPAGEAWISGPSSAEETYPSGPPEGVLFFFCYTTGEVSEWVGSEWLTLTDLTGPFGYGWSVGVGDPTGAPTDSKVYYLNLLNGEVWWYYSSAWHYTTYSMKGATGAAGAAGADGADGAPGGPWLCGSGVPGSEAGSDGDWYLDTESEKVYRKASGSWSELADFSGGGASLTAPLVLPAAAESGLVMPGVEGQYDWRVLAAGTSFSLDYQGYGGDWTSPTRVFTTVGGEEMIFTPGVNKFNNASGRQVILGPGIVDAADSFQVGGVQIVEARKTGWAAPTGSADRTTFATSTVTTEELAKRVKALIDDLTSHGLIGPTP